MNRIPLKPSKVPLETRMRWLQATIDMLRAAGQDVKYEEEVLDGLLKETLSKLPPSRIGDSLVRGGVTRYDLADD
jgi:hypothetical protein